MKILLLLAALSVPAASCASLSSALPLVVAGIQDAALILDAIQTFANDVFRKLPDEIKQRDLNAAVARARTALDLALRLATAADDLDQRKIDAAFLAFRDAYADVLRLGFDLGIRPGDVGAPRAAPGILTVPQPLAMTLRVR